MAQVRIIAWGLGVCSTTMAVMSVLHDLPPIDAIVNTDPGWELPATYAARDFYAGWFRERGMKVVIEETGPIRMNAFIPRRMVPFWTAGGAPLSRQCTGWHKREPGKRIARRLAGYDERRPPHPPSKAIEMWLGFTIEEWHRMKSARQKFLKFEHPLVQHKITRAACVKYLQERDLPVPPRSACVCCPFRLASDWLEIRETMPGVWADACAFDQAIRSGAWTSKGIAGGDIFLFKGINGPEPLETAPLEECAAHERKLEWFQLPLLCGDGGCWT